MEGTNAEADTARGFVRLLQTDECTTVLCAQYSHQRGKADAGDLRGLGAYREADRMDTHTALPGVVLAVDDIHALDHGVDGRTGEFVAKHIQADALVGGA